MNNAPETSVGPAPSTNGHLIRSTFCEPVCQTSRPTSSWRTPTFNIIYANERALETLRGIEDEIRKAFDVDVDDIVGATIHRFHKDKRRVERILRNPAALPHQAEFSFGNITLQAKINGVFGPSNDVLGYIVNWEDVSQRQRIESEQSRLASMLENAPTNVLLADRDLKIIYVNPASLATLRKLERYLPVKPENVTRLDDRYFPQRPGLPAQDPLQRQELAGAGQYQDRPRDGRPARHRHLRQEQELPRAHGHLGADHREAGDRKRAIAARVDAGERARQTCCWPTAT